MDPYSRIKKLFNKNIQDLNNSLIIVNDLPKLDVPEKYQPYEDVSLNIHNPDPKIKNKSHVIKELSKRQYKLLERIEKIEAFLKIKFNWIK